MKARKVYQVFKVRKVVETRLDGLLTLRTLWTPVFVHTPLLPKYKGFGILVTQKWHNQTELKQVQFSVLFNVIGQLLFVI